MKSADGGNDREMCHFPTKKKYSIEFEYYGKQA